MTTDELRAAVADAEEQMRLAREVEDDELNPGLSGGNAKQVRL